MVPHFWNHGSTALGYGLLPLEIRCINVSKPTLEIDKAHRRDTLMSDSDEIDTFEASGSENRVPCTLFYCMYWNRFRTGLVLVLGMVEDLSLIHI